MKATVMHAHRRSKAVISLLTSLLAIGGVLAPSAAAETMRERHWHLDKMQAERMWEVSTGEGITVAVLDSGVQASETELRGKVLKGQNLVEPKKDARIDAAGHGTAMATLIAGNGANGQGIKGLAPGARILPVKIEGSVKEVELTSIPKLIAAIRYAADSDAQIINMSVGFEDYAFEDNELAQLQEAVDYAIGKGKLLFAASGNDGEHDIVYPASSNGVAAVGAVDDTLTWVKFSNYGPRLALAAPGKDIPVPCPEDKPGYCRSEGTSQATAIASASAALIWAKHPKWTGNQVLRVMLETAGKPKGKVPSRYVGYGFVRPRINLLEGKGDPGPADVNPLVEANKDDSASPSPSASKKPVPDTSAPADAPQDEAASGSGSDSAENAGKIVGIVAAVALPALALFVILRRRKARALVGAVPAPTAPPFGNLPPAGAGHHLMPPTVPPLPSPSPPNPHGPGPHSSHSGPPPANTP
ncbi:S8 family serine peptidase [Streptomyces sp. XD-27]|uniref:S8 family serine peptidase n=1 Tax=Streptomyces sp. XD-27 TaxID=3062779 RepID=UPI0026F41098|nr:S8 family serine peptidase [Streptomyces sp. XD-27]WKX72912.1 S8 family serine peptidase [Streptomyces sp. XD-27]